MAKPSASNVQMIPIADINFTPFLQTRSGGVVDEVVREYAELLKAGVKFPPVVVYELSDRFKGKLTLAIGFHRVAAHKKAGIQTIEAEVRKGKWCEAWLSSWTSNLTHGVRYSNADKREATKTALKLFPKDSPAVLAEKLGVSDELVRKVRKTLITTGQIEDTEKLVGRDGRAQAAKQSKDNKRQGPTVGPCQEPTSECQPEPAAPEPEPPAEVQQLEYVPAAYVTDPIPATAPQSTSELILAALDRTAHELVTFRSYPSLVGLFRELDAARDQHRISTPQLARPDEKATSPPDQDPDKCSGEGILRAEAAIAILKRIPKRDALRYDGFKIVDNWIRREERLARTRESLGAKRNREVPKTGSG
jgi:transposase-like protein